MRFEKATKENCLVNFLDMFEIGFGFDDTFTLVLDNVKDETVEWTTELLKGYVNNPNIMRTNGGSSAAGFRIVFEEALKLDDELVYFVEDDYWHLPKSRQILLEGLSRAKYVSLYDHLDTYIPASMGGNKFVTDEGYSSFPTLIIRTDSSHWRTVSSTTMTFASSVKVLREDKEIWDNHTTGTYPQDFLAFMDLSKKQRSLITPIPSLSTHCEPAWAAPGIDWEKILEDSVAKKMS